MSFQYPKTLNISPCGSFNRSAINYCFLILHLILCSTLGNKGKVTDLEELRPQWRIKTYLKYNELNVIIAVGLPVTFSGRNRE